MPEEKCLVWLPEVQVKDWHIVWALFERKGCLLVTVRLHTGLRLCVNHSFIDVYTRCKVKWNLIFTDPKGELLAKFYYSLSKRQYEVVQFNLLNPNLTNQFNPLINALQEFRQNNDVEGQSQVDSLAGIIFVESENSKGVNYNQKALRTAWVVRIMTKVKPRKNLKAQTTTTRGENPNVMVAKAERKFGMLIQFICKAEIKTIHGAKSTHQKGLFR